MTEDELYRELGTLTKKKDIWRDKIPYVGSLLEGQSSKITAKALWLLGEMGLQYPDEVVPYVSQIVSFLNSSDALLRERAVNALGRIGRACYEMIMPWWENLMLKAKDSNPRVRLAFIWASENIATNTPDIYEDYMPLYVELLNDSDDKVRMEAPEMFRVMGKRRPQKVYPYLGQLQWLAENDPNHVVRIHCAGAIRITNKASV
ncbi:MAG: sister chromatid cohesion protein PDS5 [Bacteroidales bacterium]|nr:sister chromatid cohesion protein PDS5 [Bacteroidales bacterium]